MTLRGVIFDMGGTLLHFEAPGATWEESERLCALGVYQRLGSAGYDLPPEESAVAAAVAYSVGVWRTLHTQDVQTLKLAAQVRAMAELWGVTDVPDAVADALGEAYMAALRAHLRTTDGAVATLAALRDQGWRLGLLSNTFWPADVHRRDLEEHGLSEYLEHCVFSAEVDIWKPDPRAFNLAREGLGLAAEETVYVGDSLFWDIWGAQRAGMRGVWIEQPSQVLPEGVEVTPDAAIARLPELLDVLTAWNRRA